MSETKKIRCLVVDDEPIARKGMSRLISSRPELELVATADSAESAAEMLGRGNIDLIFLDIQMPGINGMEFARRLPADSLVVFTTAFSEYAVESYDVDAVDYLLKPIDPARFDKAVDKAVDLHRILAEKLSSDGDGAGHDAMVVASGVIVVKSDRRYVRIRIDDILFVEGLKDYVIIRLEDRRIITRMTIKNIIDILPSDRFIRCSKSYVVNRDKVDSFDNNDIFIGSNELAIGPSYREQVIKSLLG